MLGKHQYKQKLPKSTYQWARNHRTPSLPCCAACARHMLRYTVKLYKVMSDNTVSVCARSMPWYTAHSIPGHTIINVEVW